MDEKEYAVCDLCAREMSPGTPCEYDMIAHPGGWIKRDTSNLGNAPICHDCNAPLGKPHHPGCDNERCPICGGQLISCDCNLADENGMMWFKVEVEL